MQAIAHPFLARLQEGLQNGTSVVSDVSQVLDQVRPVSPFHAYVLFLLRRTDPLPLFVRCALFCGKSAPPRHRVLTHPTFKMRSSHLYKCFNPSGMSWVLSSRDTARAHSAWRDCVAATSTRPKIAVRRSAFLCPDYWSRSHHGMNNSRTLASCTSSTGFLPAFLDSPTSVLSLSRVTDASHTQLSSCFRLTPA